MSAASIRAANAYVAVDLKGAKVSQELDRLLRTMRAKVRGSFPTSYGPKITGSFNSSLGGFAGRQGTSSLLGFDHGRTLRSSKFGGGGTGLLGGSARVAGGILAAQGAARIAGVFPKVLRQSKDFEETLNKFQLVFKDLAKETEAWADTTARSVNRSKSAFLEFSSQFQNFFVGFGYGRKQASEMSKTLTQLSIDLGSFHNVPDEESARRLFQGLAGSTEALDVFGINAREAKVREQLKRSGIPNYDKATANQKVLARFNIILEATRDAQGDAKKTADSFANSLRGVSSAGKQLAINLGLIFTRSNDMAVATGKQVGLLAPLVTKFRDVTFGVAQYVEENEAAIRASVVHAAQIALLYNNYRLLSRGVSVAVGGLGGMVSVMTSLFRVTKSLTALRFAESIGTLARGASRITGLPGVRRPGPGTHPGPGRGRGSQYNIVSRRIIPSQWGDGGPSWSSRPTRGTVGADGVQTFFVGNRQRLGRPSRAQISGPGQRLLRGPAGPGLLGHTPYRYAAVGPGARLGGPQQRLLTGPPGSIRHPLAAAGRSAAAAAAASTVAARLALPAPAKFKADKWLTWTANMQIGVRGLTQRWKAYGAAQSVAFGAQATRGADLLGRTVGLLGGRRDRGTFHRDFMERREQSRLARRQVLARGRLARMSLSRARAGGPVGLAVAGAELAGAAFSSAAQGVGVLTQSMLSLVGITTNLTTLFGGLAAALVALPFVAAAGASLAYEVSQLSLEKVQDGVKIGLDAVGLAAQQLSLRYAEAADRIQKHLAVGDVSGAWKSGALSLSDAFLDAFSIVAEGADTLFESMKEIFASALPESIKGALKFGYEALAGLGSAQLIGNVTKADEDIKREQHKLDSANDFNDPNLSETDRRRMRQQATRGLAEAEERREKAIKVAQFAGVLPTWNKPEDSKSPIEKAKQAIDNLRAKEVGDLIGAEFIKSMKTDLTGGAFDDTDANFGTVPIPLEGAETDREKELKEYRAKRDKDSKDGGSGYRYDLSRGVTSMKQAAQRFQQQTQETFRSVSGGRSRVGGVSDNNSIVKAYSLGFRGKRRVGDSGVVSNIKDAQDPKTQGGLEAGRQFAKNLTATFGLDKPTKPKKDIFDIPGLEGVAGKAGLGKAFKTVKDLHRFGEAPVGKFFRGLGKFIGASAGGPDFEKVAARFRRNDKIDEKKKELNQQFTTQLATHGSYSARAAGFGVTNDPSLQVQTNTLNEITKIRRAVETNPRKLI